MGDRDIGAFLRRFAHMLDRLPKDATILVTLIPPTRFKEESDRTRRFNLALIPLLRRRRVRIIDPWSQVTRNGVIDKPYTVDGVHLNEAGYRIWQAAIRHDPATVELERIRLIHRFAANRFAFHFLLTIVR